MQNGKLIQISDNMCPVDWDDDVFESMMKLLSKKMRVSGSFMINLYWNGIQNI